MTGLADLLRLAWRRDRVMISVTVLVIWLMTWFSAVATIELYATEAERVVAAKVANATPSVVAIYGTIYDLTSIGGIGSAKLQMLDLIAMAVLVIAIIRRHTRQEEETGRFELLGATVVGRYAPLGAAVVLAVITSLVTGIGVAIGCAAGGLPSVGAWLIGLSVAGVGLAWTGLTAIAVQLSSSNQVCGAYAFGSLGVAFLLRMIGDLNENNAASFVRWLSPLGWAQQLRPFSGDRWWPLVFFVLVLAGSVAVAVRLQSTRDLGAGLLPDRKGRGTGRIGSAAGLAWRLQRGSLIGWAVAFLVMGMVMGSLRGNSEGFLTPEAQDILRKMGGLGKIDDLFATVYVGMAGLAAGAYGVASALKLRAEETRLHAEHVLATATTRFAYLTSHVAYALLGGLALPVVSGLGAAMTDKTGTDKLTHDVLPYLALAPATWVVVGIALVLFGWLPRFAGLAWAVLAGFVLLGELGQLLGIPENVQKLSPYAALPRMPYEDFRLAPVAVLVAIAIALVAVGYMGFRRRDLTTA